MLLDGPVEPLGRGGTFLGQHIWTALRGVAVQINAFNFPVWGPLEKLGPAFLAGMPSLIKPASQTAYLTHRMVELIVESGLLPDGSVQLVAGSAGDLLDHLTEQDVVGFTGSASTAQRLRTHPVVVANGVRFTAEADSLNCSILGPDAEPGTAEFDLFVKQLTNEMTVKAGQKCTAIRRAIVPTQFARRGGRGGIRAAGEGRRRQPGQPRRPDGRAGQPRAARGGAPLAQGAASTPDGSCSAIPSTSRSSTPTPSVARSSHRSCIRADADRAEPHEVEAFGPVSTLIGYDTIADAIALAARGQGSLVGSLVTHDADFAREVVLGVAPWHGRLLVLDRDDAGESTGHGSPLPMLVHGGPGRAGGGEEMGGVRGVHHHMQRTAVQGTPRMLTAVTGRWMPGADRSVTDVHPFRKSLAQLRIGDSVVAGPRTVTADDIDHFAEFTGDTFYAHTDRWRPPPTRSSTASSRTAT